MTAASCIRCLEKGSFVPNARGIMSDAAVAACMMMNDRLAQYGHGLFYQCDARGAKVVFMAGIFDVKNAAIICKPDVFWLGTTFHDIRKQGISFVREMT